MQIPLLLPLSPLSLSLSHSIALPVSPSYYSLSHSRSLSHLLSLSRTLSPCLLYLPIPPFLYLLPLSTLSLKLLVSLSLSSISLSRLCSAPFICLPPSLRSVLMPSSSTQSHIFTLFVHSSLYRSLSPSILSSFSPSVHSLRPSVPIYLSLRFSLPPTQPPFFPPSLPLTLFPSCCPSPSHPTSFSLAPPLPLLLSLFRSHYITLSSQYLSRITLVCFPPSLILLICLLYLSKPLLLPSSLYHTISPSLPPSLPLPLPLLFPVYLISFCKFFLYLRLSLPSHFVFVFFFVVFTLSSWYVSLYKRTMGEYFYSL